MDKVIGIDLGGTNVRVAVVSEDGIIHDEIIRDSHADKGPEFVLAEIVSMIKQLKDYNSCKAIGLGLPGPVDQSRGCVTLATNLVGFAGYPVRDYLEKALNKKVYMENDAKVAALGEATFGAGKGYPIVYYVTQSTGVGGGLVINGHIHAGAFGYAGEVSNVIIDPCRKPYKDMSPLHPGTIEVQGSGTALERKARDEYNLDIEKAKEIFALYQENDEQAVALIEQMAFDMAVLLSAIAHIVNPNVFVLGGGVTYSKDLYWDQMIAHFNELVYPGLKETEFKQAALDQPGLIGAAALAFSYKEEE